MPFFLFIDVRWISHNVYEKQEEANYKEILWKIIIHLSVILCPT